MTPEEQALWLLMPVNEHSAGALAWAIEGTEEEWRIWAEETLARTRLTQETPETQRLRADVRQTLALPSFHTKKAPLSDIANFHASRAEECARYEQSARQEGNLQETRRWMVEKKASLLLLAGERGDLQEEEKLAKDIIATMAELPPSDTNRWRGAYALIRRERFEEALPIMRVYVESTWTDWPWLVRYAACLWKATEDVESASLVLKQAAKQRRSTHNHPKMTEEWVWRHYAMGDVPEFVSAI